MLVFLVIATIGLNWSELVGIRDVIRGARLTYLPILVLLEVLFVLNLGLFYASTFRASGVRASVLRFILVSSGAHFVNLVSKSSGFGGLALFLKESNRQGESSLKTITAFMAAYALGYAAFLCVLVISIVLLFVRGSLTTMEVVASALLFILVIAVASLMTAGLRSEAALEQLLLTVISPINACSRWLFKRVIVGPEKLQDSARELFEGVHAMLGRPRSFLVPFGHALAVEFLSASGLLLVALSLNAHLSFELAVAGYALSLLFAILSVTPAGLGFVEVSLVVFLVSTGMTRHEALAVTLGFRLFDFWLPVAVGSLSLAALRLTERPTA
jgi:uncharacterized protein (TIRG00374 family)